MAIKRRNSNNEWVVDQRAIETSIIDLNNNFESMNVEGALRELAEKTKNSSGTGAIEIEYGSVAPTDKNISLWIDTTSDNGSSSLLSDALILEFKSVIADLNSQIADLRARVLYLEQNGSSGGGSGGTEIVGSSYINLEDGTQLMLEDGTMLLLESSENAVIINTLMTLEDGTILTFGDGTQMSFE